MTENRSGVLNKYYSKYEHDPEFIAEEMAIRIIEDALQIMQAKGINKSELSNRMGVSRAHISRLFNAPPNLTLHSIARLAAALDVTPHISLDTDAEALSKNDVYLSDIAPQSGDIRKQHVEHI
jgi:transcriptional regulator with XRE-family HTH domain